MFRLQFFARGVQGYIKKIRESLQEVSGDQMKDEESRIKVTALRTTSNVNSLIRDLFRNPPVFKAVVTLSFKPTANSQVSLAPNLPYGYLWLHFHIYLHRPQRLWLFRTLKRKLPPLKQLVTNVTLQSLLRIRRRKIAKLIADNGSLTSFRLENSAQTLRHQVIFLNSFLMKNELMVFFYCCLDSRPRGRGGYRGGRGFRRGGYWQDSFLYLFFLITRNIF